MLKCKGFHVGKHDNLHQFRTDIKGICPSSTSNPGQTFTLKNNVLAMIIIRIMAYASILYQRLC